MTNGYKGEIRCEQIIYVLHKGERYFLSKEDERYVKRNNLIGVKVFGSTEEKETQDRYEDGGYARSSSIRRTFKLNKL